MEVHRVLCMNGGEGETSYAHNSLIQKQGMANAKPILEESLKELCHGTLPTECLTIADLGCSSGPNTLSIVAQIIDIVDATCKQVLNHKEPMFQVFLNDLPRNDYNTISQLLPSFHERIKRLKGLEFGPCFIAAMPGSFYGRLFPNNSLHFVHSSYSLHWLSQVPKELVFESSRIPLNKGNIYIAKTSPHSVLESYLDQFQHDFLLFLRYRAEEMIPGGHMVLTVVGKNGNDAESSSENRCTIWELLGNTLNDMVLEGLIEEEKLDWFNIPYYAPSAEEVGQIIEREGSFDVRQVEIFEVDWEANIRNIDGFARGKNVAKSIRAVVEPVLATHFGNVVMDGLFERFAKKIKEYLEVEEGKCTNIVISLTNKA